MNFLQTITPGIDSGFHVAQSPREGARKILQLLIFREYSAVLGWRLLKSSRPEQVHIEPVLKDGLAEKLPPNRLVFLCVCLCQLMQCSNSENSVKVLWVKPGKLLPLDAGGKLRTYHILRHLSASHDVTYLSYYAGEKDKTYEGEISRLIPGAFPFSGAGRDVRGFRRLMDYVFHVGSLTPYAVNRFTSSRVRKLVSQWMAQGRFDIAVCDFLASSLNFPAVLESPVLLFQHNVETVLWERRARLTRGSLARLVADLESMKMRRYERAQVNRFDRVVAVSEQDRRWMSEMVAPSRIGVVPTGVDLAEFRRAPKTKAVRPLVVFVGSMDWEPNIDGVEYFCREIWPQVLSAVPAACFRIVGRDPDVRVKKLSSSSIDLTGTVSSVIPHIAEATALVVPLRIGGGTRLKIYEGMALGKATVSTQVGAEGLNVEHGRDILLADQSKDFANCVIKVLQDQPFREQLERAAVVSVTQFDWSVIATRLVEEMQATIDSFSIAKHQVQTEPSFRGAKLSGSVQLEK